MSIQATVIGHLGGEAEAKTLPSGKVVTNFSVASKGRGRDAGTTWVRAQLWGQRGASLAQYLTKGSRVAVHGSLSTREYNGKTYVDLEVHEVDLLGDKQKPASDFGERPADDPSIPF
jgi:single-strand DNA-binding protein